MVPILFLRIVISHIRAEVIWSLRSGVTWLDDQILAGINRFVKRLKKCHNEMKYITASNQPFSAKIKILLKVYVNILYLVGWCATRCASKNTGIFCTQFSPENHRCIAYTGVIVLPKVCVYIVALCCFTIKDVG